MRLSHNMSGTRQRTTALCTLLCVLVLAGRAEAQKVTPPPQGVVERLKLSPFYKKCLLVNGLPVLGSEKVSDYALRETKWLLERMLAGRGDIVKALRENRLRVVVMAYNERTTEVPEHSDLTPANYWDRRARGLGATPERPAISCAEENLLDYPGDPYRGENIFVHEFAHAIHIMGLTRIDPKFEPALKRCFEQAKAKGLWKGTYAATNMAEYWAEGVQSWFDCNASMNASHNEVNTREKLKEYDPDMEQLIHSVFRNEHWRYQRPAERKEQAHLKGYDSASTPRFKWDPEVNRWYKEYMAKNAEPR